MGEKSKATGDFGESIVNSILELIGWVSPPRNFDIKCFAPDDHRKGIHPRQSHGIDTFYRYLTPLFESTEDILIISSKYEKYPDNPSTRFKAHIRDITDALYCLKKGKQYPSENNLRKQIIGVLFWLSADNTYSNLKEKLAQCNYQSETRSDFESVYLVDNKQANFLYQAISYIKNSFSDCILSFYYPDTGYNDTARGRVTSDQILPVQYINSTVIPFKLIDKANSSEYLALCIDENYDQQSLNSLLNMSHKLTEGWPQKIFLLFSSFDKLNGTNTLNQAKVSFKDREFILKVTVDTFNPDFRNIF